MRLIVKRNDQVINEYHFDKGPVYIGRHTHSQVFLGDEAVSRQHAVIFIAQDGKWIVEDLKSINRTCLNNKTIQKAEIKDGDTLRIADFFIEIDLKETTTDDKPIHLEDTLVLSHDRKTIVRKVDSDHAPAIRLPGKRAKDFLQATKEICRVNGIDKVLRVLLRIIARQFSANRVWCALRSDPAGAMTCHAGKQRSGPGVQLNELKLKEKITQAIESGQFLLYERVPAQLADEKVRSAMIAPVVSSSGCFGVLYVDNTMAQEHYSAGDLDYLMLLAVHTAAILENF
ncbi:MAG: FHA domain-containing protein [Planctomycetota bacterium]